MHDQADQLRQLVRSTIQVDATLAPGGPIIALSGGQQGVGVTTAACGLARELARLGKQVIIIDANLNNPDATTLLQQQITTTTRPNSPTTTPPNSPDLARSGLTGSLQDVLTGNRRAVEVLLPSSEEGVRLLPGAPRGAAPPLDRAALDSFAAELAALSRQADAILIDAGQGMNAWIDRLWQLASEVLLVATPHPQCLLDSYAAVKLSQHHRVDRKLRLLLNRTDDDEVPPLAKRFDDTCQRFLFVTPKPAASLPAQSRNNEPFQRALRHLAADLACDFRASALRLIQPPTQRQHSMLSLTNKEKDLTPRR